MPDNYEGSVFAFISSANMFTYWVVSTLFAVFINNDLMTDPVTQKNISTFYKLALVALFI